MALLTASGMWAADGDVFTANTIEGVEMTFKVISEANKTCQVGTGSPGWSGGRAVPQSTTAITIPSEVNGYSVTAIAQAAFYDCWVLSNITIPQSVTTIGNSAFYQCLSLSSITIPQGVTSIGGGVFNDSGLTNVVVEEGNGVYDSRNGCNAIINSSTNELILGCKNTVIPDGVTSIGSYAFIRCTDKINYVIPNSVTSIGEGAFYWVALTDIIIPKSVTSIGENAFNGLYVTSIVVDEDNTTYDSRNGCNAIINSSTNELIRGCQNTIIPDGVTRIGDYAFAECYLTNITIPNSVTAIGEYAFRGCPKLTSITIPSSVASIGYRAFSYCDKLANITISDGVESIDAYAFENCGSLISIIIPKSIKSLGYNAFNYSGIKNVISLIESPHVSYYSFGFDYPTLLFVPMGTKEKYKEWEEYNAIIREIGNANITLDKEVVTFAYGLPLDFSTPISGLKAYVISDVTDGKAVLTEVTSKVPANTGLILKGTAGQTYEIPYVIENVDAITNKLVGVTLDKSIGGNNLDYILSNGKFVKASAGTLAAGKAYLKLDAALARGTIDIVGDVTGIDALQNNKEESIKNDEVYNLNGQRVSKPAKGLYVVGGKKVMVK